MKKVVFSLFALALFVACGKMSEVQQESSDKTIPEEKVRISIVGHIDSNEESKTSYDFSSGTAGIMTWSSDDIIALVVNNGGNVTNQNRYQLGVESLSDDGKTATFSTLIEKHKVESGWLSSGFAVYPVAVSQNNNSSGYSYPYVKLPSSRTGAVSEIVLVGTPDDDIAPTNFNFKTAMSVLKVTVTNIPAQASSLKLVTNNGSAYPVDGDFSLIKNGIGIAEITNSNYLGWGNGYISIDLSSSDAIASRDFYFNIPTGTYPASTLSVVLEDEGSNKIFEKTIAKALTFSRGTVIASPAIPCPDWYSIGKGKFRDDHVFSLIGGGIPGFVDVEIQRSTSKGSSYRMLDPYGAAWAASSNSPAAATTAEFDFSILSAGEDPKWSFNSSSSMISGGAANNGQVLFGQSGRINTGLSGDGQAVVFPSFFGSLDAAFFTYDFTRSRVVKYGASGTIPSIVQMLPRYDTNRAVASGSEQIVVLFPSWETTNLSTISLSSSMLSGFDSETYSGDDGGVEALVDGDNGTYWHSPWSFNKTQFDTTYGIPIDIELASAIREFVVRYNVRNSKNDWGQFPYQVKIAAKVSEDSDWVLIEDRTIGVSEYPKNSSNRVQQQWFNYSYSGNTSYKFIRIGLYRSFSTDGTDYYTLNQANKNSVHLAEIQLYGN